MGGEPSGPSKAEQPWSRPLDPKDAVRMHEFRLRTQSLGFHFEAEILPCPKRAVNKYLWFFYPQPLDIVCPRCQQRIHRICTTYPQELWKSCAVLGRRDLVGIDGIELLAGPLGVPEDERFTS